MDCKTKLIYWVNRMVGVAVLTGCGLSAAFACTDSICEEKGPWHQCVQVDTSKEWVCQPACQPPVPKKCVPTPTPAPAPTPTPAPAPTPTPKATPAPAPTPAS